MRGKKRTDLTPGFERSTAPGRGSGRGTHVTSPHGGVNLKTKAEVRGNKHLPEIRKSRGSGSADTGRNLENIPLRGQRQGVFVSKGRGAVPSVEGRRFPGWVRSSYCGESEDCFELPVR